MRSSRSASFLIVTVAILVAAAFALAPLGTSHGGHVSAVRAARANPNAVGSTQALKTFTLYAGLWRTDHSFVSTIRMQNSLVVAPVDVQPILFMADGTLYPLPSVHVPVSGVVTLDINEALSRMPAAIASHLSEFGTAALIYRYPTPGHVFASISMVDVPRSLSFTCPFGELMDHEGPEQTVEGLWWKHDSGVSAFMALSNLEEIATKVKVQVVGSRGDAGAERVIQLEPHSTRMMNLEELILELPAQEKQAGGVRVQYQGQMGGVAVTGGLENDGEGYSANMPFFFHDVSSAPTTEIDFASAGIMVGKPDPIALPGFPSDTTFRPYLVLRNATEKPMEPRIQLNYMAGDKPVSLALSNGTLRPFETKQIDLGSALDAAGLKGFNGIINLSVSVSERIGDLLLATGSVDQSGTYVSEVEPQSVGGSGRKIGPYWSVGNGNNTMFGLWNPTAEAQDILVTFFYGDGSGKYLLPVHLDPQGSTMILLANLIAEKKPDANGNVIPPGVIEGSASFENAGQGKRMTLVIAGGTFNVADATCHPICINCCGETLALLPFDPFCPVGAVLDCFLQGTNCDGTISTITVTSWSSSNTAVATISSSGVMTAVAPGQVTMSALTGPIDIKTGQICLLYPTCDQPVGGASQQMAVVPKISQDKPLWYFGSGNTPPSGFSLGGITATLTANGAGNGTYVWTITNGTSKAILENGSSTVTKTNANTVGISSTSPSTQANDVTVQLQFTPSGGSQLPATYSLSIDSPFKLVLNGKPTTTGGATGVLACEVPTPNPNGTNGYQTLIPYSMISRFGALITFEWANETFALQADDYIGNTWPAYEVKGGFTSTGNFVDNICTIGTGLTPLPQPPQSPLGSVKIDHGSQAWFVGTMTEGGGVEVQSDVLTRYQDHGTVTSIVSPTRQQ